MKKHKNDIVFNYDGSFEGLMTVIFEIYDLQVCPIGIHENAAQIALFQDNQVEVLTDEGKATRVLKGIESKYGKGECNKIFRVFMTEDDNRSMLLYQYIKLLFDSKMDKRTAYQLDEVLYIKQQLKKMRREVHRMHAFIRFQETKNEIFFSVIEPDFNVLPFTVGHFKKRYRNQKWIIFDKKRGYGVNYDKKKMSYFQWADPVFDSSLEEILADGENDYATWWRAYFKSTNIVERKNMKLHLRHVPKRYWKYLTEKH